MHRPFADRPRSPGRRPEPSARRAGALTRLSVPFPVAVPSSAVTERAAVRACRTR